MLEDSKFNDFLAFIPTNITGLNFSTLTTSNTLLFN